MSGWSPSDRAKSAVWLLPRTWPRASPWSRSCASCNAICTTESADTPRPSLSTSCRPPPPNQRGTRRLGATSSLKRAGVCAIARATPSGNSKSMRAHSEAPPGPGNRVARACASSRAGTRAWCSLRQVALPTDVEHGAPHDWRIKVGMLEEHAGAPVCKDEEGDRFVVPAAAPIAPLMYCVAQRPLALRRRPVEGESDKSALDKLERAHIHRAEGPLGALRAVACPLVARHSGERTQRMRVWSAPFRVLIMAISARSMSAGATRASSGSVSTCTA